MIIPTQSLLPENTKQTQGTEIHDPGGIRIGKPSQRAPADPRLRQRSHRKQFRGPISIEYGLKDREIGVQWLAGKEFILFSTT